ncbi:transmembrane transport protein [Actinomadura logoneensis]|uniref:Transmembrane transport protein n=1 Tax=Actinomadura logoneensis TaxID=2293572 RepID=A0A372JFU0_9ACTN|nr:ABC transporter permease subunit [Actinomadura logoneensis]RFU38676.1 transmembrane transport protein [Actinomadura logoneensis]
MIWLSWRQFRWQALVAAVALVLVAAYALYLGSDVRDAFAAARSNCGTGTSCPQAMAELKAHYRETMLFLAAALGLALALLGTFWGAPLVARELEAGTHRLVWNQSVTRRRWLATKLLVTALTAMAVTGVASALLTWAARPVDEASANRFDTILFGSRNLAPVGYALFAVTLGTVIGLVVRRTLPAIGVTMAAFIAVQFLVPNLVRPHLMPPETATMAMSADAINRARNLGSITGGSVIGGVTLPDEPDAWISSTSPLLTADGRPLSSARFDACLNSPPRTGVRGTFGDTAVCLGKLDLHLRITYQPGTRYWAFQLLETGFYVLLSALLAAFALWRIRHRLT